METEKMSREQLISRVKELERLNKQLKKDVDQSINLNMSWANNLGHWYLDFTSGSVTFNDLKIKALGYERNEMPNPVPYSFFMDKVHPDYYESTMQHMRSAMSNPENSYEATYQIQNKDGSWRWFYDIGKVVQWDENGKALLAAGIVFDVTDQKNQEADLRSEKSRLSHVANTDALTGIMNRHAIINELHYRLNPNLSQTNTLSLAMFDIDNFKAINDTYGHLVGDEVLAKVAEIISNTIRGFDTVGRYGGEEFLVIFPNTELHKAERATNRIRANIENNVFETVGHVTISGGVTEFNNDTDIELIERADKLLYQAKSNGRNRIEFE